jgi:nucleoside-diphosphate-sugar epimerase
MNVLVLGGTGSIGRAVVRELVQHGDRVLALARSDDSARRLVAYGATPVMGDIVDPVPWLAALPPVDGIVHVAATFDESEEQVQGTLLDALIAFLTEPARRRTRLIYTGGCWLYGETNGSVTTEDSPFEPLAEFAWAVAHVARLRALPELDQVVIHPGMVYEATAGVFTRFHADATAREAVRVIGSEQVRWPLVHAEDLARLYRLALHAAPPRSTYLGTAIDSLAVGDVARAFAARYRTPRLAPDILSTEAAVAELGAWARGYAHDQRQSGARAREQLGWHPRHLDPLEDIRLAP